jgi:hypothetical protein
LKYAKSFTDEGTLIFPGFAEQVAYDFQCDQKRRSGKGSLKGLNPEQMRSAFKRGQMRLRLADGGEMPIVVVAHTEGDNTAFFEIQE